MRDRTETDWLVPIYFGVVPVIVLVVFHESWSIAAALLVVNLVSYPLFFRGRRVSRGAWTFWYFLLLCMAVSSLVYIIWRI